MIAYLTIYSKQILYLYFKNVLGFFENIFIIHTSFSIQKIEFRVKEGGVEFIKRKFKFLQYDFQPF